MNAIVLSTGMNNVIPFTKSLAWHAAATHVLGLALKRARLLGLISVSGSDQLLEHAQRDMDVAEVRATIGLVLLKLEDHKRASNAV